MSAKERIAEDQPNQAPQPERPQEPRLDVKSEVAQKLIEAMEKGETPWQKPWSSHAMRPRNPVTGNSYRGINRVLLSLVGGNGLFVTYQQAQAQGWQVRKGERGTMIVKVVDLDAEYVRPGAGSGPREGEREQGKESARRNVILKRYYVFGSHQIDGMPDLAPSEELDFHPVEKAEAILAAFQEKTGLRILHGKREACYVPAMDEVHLPNKKSFKSVYDYYATAFHEVGGHATLHAKRLDRKDALGKRWGDQAYALEELRAEIASAILSAEVGIEMTEPQRAKHMANHAAYLQSWLKALRSDPMAIFTAAKDAERMVEYTLSLERQAVAMKEHAEWVAEYDAAR